MLRLELEVAEAAGAAARAVAVTGAYVMGVGFGAVDPIANWLLMSPPTCSSPRPTFGQPSSVGIEDDGSTLPVTITAPGGHHLLEH